MRFFRYYNSDYFLLVLIWIRLISGDFDLALILLVDSLAAMGFHSMKKLFAASPSASAQGQGFWTSRNFYRRTDGVGAAAIVQPRLCSNTNWYKCNQVGTTGDTKLQTTSKHQQGDIAIGGVLWYGDATVVILAVIKCRHLNLLMNL